MTTLYHNTQRHLAEQIVREGFAGPGPVYLAVKPVEVCDSRVWVEVQLDSLRGLRREHGDSDLYHATVYCVSARAINRRTHGRSITTQADLDAAASE